MIFVHCYVPGALTEVMLIPLVKNKNKDITDTNNYRPIAIVNNVSKVFGENNTNAYSTRCEHL